MEAVKADGVKFNIVYSHAVRTSTATARCGCSSGGTTTKHKLGESPLPDGAGADLRDNGNDGLAYLGEKLLRYVPMKAEIEVNLGPDDLVVYEMKKDQVSRFNFAFDPKNNDNVCGWDEKRQWNHTDPQLPREAHRLRTSADDGRRRGIHVGSPSRQAPFDFHTTETKLSVDVRAKKEYPCTVLTHQGTNTKRQRNLLKDATR